MTNHPTLSAISPFFPLWTWVPILDGDDEARLFFDRHYSRRFYKDGREPKLLSCWKCGSYKLQPTKRGEG